MEAVPPFSLNGGTSVAAASEIRISLPPDAYSPYAPSFPSRSRESSSVTPRVGTGELFYNIGSDDQILGRRGNGERVVPRGDSDTGIHHDRAWHIDSGSARSSADLSMSRLSSSTLALLPESPAPRLPSSHSHHPTPRVPPLYSADTPGHFRSKAVDGGRRDRRGMVADDGREDRPAAADEIRKNGKREDETGAPTQRQHRRHASSRGHATEEETGAGSHRRDERRPSVLRKQQKRHSVGSRERESPEESGSQNVGEKHAVQSTYSAPGETDIHVPERGGFLQGKDRKPRPAAKEVTKSKEKAQKDASSRREREDRQGTTSADEGSSTPYRKRELRHLKKELREKKKEVERLRFEAKYISAVSEQAKDSKEPFSTLEKAGSNNLCFMLPPFEPTASTPLVVGDHLPAPSSAQLHSALSGVEQESLQRRAEKLQELLDEKMKLLKDLHAELQQGTRSRGAEFREILRLKEDMEKQRQELVEKDSLIRSLENDRETLSGELAALKGSALCQSADLERLRRQGEDDFRQAAQECFRLGKENENLRDSLTALEKDHRVLTTQFRTVEERSKQLEGEVRRLEGAWHAAVAEAQMKASRLTEVEEQLRTSRRYVCYLERLIRDLRFFLVYEMETQQGTFHSPEANNTQLRRANPSSASPEGRIGGRGPSGCLLDTASACIASKRMTVERSSRPQLPPVPFSSWQSPPVSSTALAQVALGAASQPLLREQCCALPLENKGSMKQRIVSVGEDGGDENLFGSDETETRGVLQERSAISGRAHSSKHQLAPAKGVRGQEHICETANADFLISACSESHGNTSLTEGCLKTEMTGVSFSSSIQEVGGEGDTHVSGVLSPIHKLSGLSRQSYELERLELRLDADRKEIDTALRTSVEEACWDNAGEVTCAPVALARSRPFSDESPALHPEAHYDRPMLEGIDESVDESRLRRSPVSSPERHYGRTGLGPVTLAGRAFSPEGGTRAGADANAALLYLDRLVERASRELAGHSGAGGKCLRRPGRLSYPVGHALPSADTPVFGVSSGLSSPRLLPPLRSPSRSQLLRAVEEPYEDAKISGAFPNSARLLYAGGFLGDQSPTEAALSPRGSEANLGAYAHGMSRYLDRLTLGRPLCATSLIQWPKMRFTKVGAPLVPRRDQKKGAAGNAACASFPLEKGGLRARGVPDYLHVPAWEDGSTVGTRGRYGARGLGRTEPWLNCGSDSLEEDRLQSDHELTSLRYLDQPDPPPVPSSLFTGEPALGLNSLSASHEHKWDDFPEPLASVDELLEKEAGFSASGLTRPKARIKCQAPPPVVVKKGGERVLNDGAAATLLAQEIRRLCPSAVGKSKPVMIAAKGMEGTQLRPRWKAV